MGASAACQRRPPSPPSIVGAAHHFGHGPPGGMGGGYFSRVQICDWQSGTKTQPRTRRWSESIGVTRAW